MSGTDTALVVGVFATAIAQIIGLVRTELADRRKERREERQHQWDMDERAIAATTAKATGVQVMRNSNLAAARIVAASGAVGAQVEASRIEVNGRVDEHVAHLQDAIADNTTKTEQATEAAHAAFKEANNVNNKIASFGVRLVAEQADGTKVETSLKPEEPT